MDNLSIFKGMNSDEIKEALKSLGSRRIVFKKEHIIVSNLFENDLIGIIIEGSAAIVKYDYLGNRNIIDNLEYDSMFGRPFLYMDKDASIVATADCEILFLDYDKLLGNNRRFEKINSNINKIIASKISELYERVEILSKRTIKEKLICYFNMLVKKKGKKTISLPITYIELADYLSVDRSAMMREIKKLKDSKIISTDGKKITIN
jgi:CRP-like cAMP-binding protein